MSSSVDFTLSSVDLSSYSPSRDSSLPSLTALLDSFEAYFSTSSTSFIPSLLPLSSSSLEPLLAQFDSTFSSIQSFTTIDSEYVVADPNPGLLASAIHLITTDQQYSSLSSYLPRLEHCYSLFSSRLRLKCILSAVTRRFRGSSIEIQERKRRLESNSPWKCVELDDQRESEYADTSFLGLLSAFQAAVQSGWPDTSPLLNSTANVLEFLEKRREIRAQMHALFSGDSALALPTDDQMELLLGSIFDYNSSPLISSAAGAVSASEGDFPGLNEWPVQRLWQLMTCYRDLESAIAAAKSGAAKGSEAGMAKYLTAAKDTKKGRISVVPLKRASVTMNMSMNVDWNAAKEEWKAKPKEKMNPTDQVMDKFESTMMDRLGALIQQADTLCAADPSLLGLADPASIDAPAAVSRTVTGQSDASESSRNPGASRHSRSSSTSMSSIDTPKVAAANPFTFTSIAQTPRRDSVGLASPAVAAALVRHRSSISSTGRGSLSLPFSPLQISDSDVKPNYFSSYPLTASPFQPFTIVAELHSAPRRSSLHSTSGFGSPMSPLNLNSPSSSSSSKPRHDRRRSAFFSDREKIKTMRSKALQEALANPENAREIVEEAEEGELEASISKHSHSPSQSVIESVNDFPLSKPTDSPQRSAQKDPATDLNAVILSGILKKKSPRGLIKAWQSRYFRLTANLLSYYKSEKDSTPAGSIPLGLIQSVTHIANKQDGKRFDIAVAGDRIFALVAESVAETKKWVDFILKASEKAKTAEKEAQKSIAATPGAAAASAPTKQIGKKYWKEAAALQAARVQPAKGSTLDSLLSPGDQQGRDSPAPSDIQFDDSVTAMIQRQCLELLLDCSSLESPSTAGFGSLYLLRDRRIPISAHSKRFFTAAFMNPQSQFQDESIRISPSNFIDPDDGFSYLHAIPKGNAQFPMNSIRTLVETPLFIDSPLFPRVIGTGETSDSYFLLYQPAVAASASLETHLKASRRFPEEAIRYWATEIVSALGILHQNDRSAVNLSPKSLYLDGTTGNVLYFDPLQGISLVDRVRFTQERPWEAEGMLEYLAPEQIRAYSELQSHFPSLDSSSSASLKSSTFSEFDSEFERLIDFWRLGILLFHLAAGYTPITIQYPGFNGRKAVYQAEAGNKSVLAAVKEEIKGQLHDGKEKLSEIYTNSINTQNSNHWLSFPNWISPELQDLIKKLLQLDPLNRLGNDGDWREILNHSFFQFSAAKANPASSSAVQANQSKYPLRFDLLDQPEWIAPPFIRHHLLSLFHFDPAETNNGATNSSPSLNAASPAAGGSPALIAESKESKESSISPLQTTPQLLARGSTAFTTLNPIYPSVYSYSLQITLKTAQIHHFPDWISLNTVSTPGGGANLPASTPKSAGKAAEKYKTLNFSKMKGEMATFQSNFLSGKNFPHLYTRFTLNSSITKESKTISDSATLNFAESFTFPLKFNDFPLENRKFSRESLLSHVLSPQQWKFEVEIRQNERLSEFPELLQAEAGENKCLLGSSELYVADLLSFHSDSKGQTGSNGFFNGTPSKHSISLLSPSTGLPVGELQFEMEVIETRKEQHRPDLAYFHSDSSLYTVFPRMSAPFSLTALAAQLSAFGNQSGSPSEREFFNRASYLMDSPAEIDSKSGDSLNSSHNSRSNPAEDSQSPESTEFDMIPLTSRLVLAPIPSDSNSLDEFPRYLDQKFGNRYRVFYIHGKSDDSGRSSLANRFPASKLVDFPLNSREIPSFASILPFCMDLDAFLRGSEASGSADSAGAGGSSVAILVSPSSTNRSLLLAALYLLFDRFFDSPELALRFLLKKRPNGFFLPSQFRYLHYFHRFVNSCRSAVQSLSKSTSMPLFPAFSSPLKLSFIRLKPIPNLKHANTIKNQGYYSPQFTIHGAGSHSPLLFDYRKHSANRSGPVLVNEPCVSLTLHSNKDGSQELSAADSKVAISSSGILFGDVKFTFYDSDYPNSENPLPIFSFWLNIHFVENAYVCLSRDQLELIQPPITAPVPHRRSSLTPFSAVPKDYRPDSNLIPDKFQVELFFEEVAMQ